MSQEITIPREGKLYKDKDGDIWQRISEDRVKRIKDGIIGGWHGGMGLIELREE